MSKWEQMELDNMQAVRQFLSEHNINACDLARYAKKLCACGTCHFFTQHYAKSGEALDWGHCWKGNIQHSKKVSTSACGFWEYGEEQEYERSRDI